MLNKILIIFLLLGGNAYAGGDWIRQQQQKDYRKIESYYYKARRLAVDLQDELKQSKANITELNKQITKQRELIAKLRKEKGELNRDVDSLRLSCVKGDSPEDAKEALVRSVTREAKTVAETTAKKTTEVELKKETGKVVKEAVKKELETRAEGKSVKGEGQ